MLAPALFSSARAWSVGPGAAGGGRARPGARAQSGQASVAQPGQVMKKQVSVVIAVDIAVRSLAVDLQHVVILFCVSLPPRRIDIPPYKSQSEKSLKYVIHQPARNPSHS